MLNYLKTFISNMIKRAVLTRPADDSKDYSVAQIKYFSKVAKCEMISPYGLFVNAPIDSHLIVWNFNGNEENKGGMAYLHADRYKNLKPGEVQVGNPFHGNYVKFDNDGNVLINTFSNMTLNSSKNINATATQNITLSAKIDATFSALNDMVLKSGGLDTFKSDSAGLTFLPEAPNTASLSSANTYMDPVTGQMQLSSSSRRFKKNIKSVGFKTSLVLKLNGRQFEKKDGDSTTYYGFIAEESYKVFPASVTLDKKGRPLAMDTMPILMALIEEVKKIHCDVEYLKKLFGEKHEQS